MKAEVYFAAAEAEPQSLSETAVVVIDVLRATTTMVAALAHGARGIFPTASAEEAVRLAASLGREDTLLCGERRGVQIEGFDLGNSPGEFTTEMVMGKRLAMTTTNGTLAFSRAFEAERVLACAFTNLGAVAEAVRGEDALVVLCAGRQGRFSLEDAVCAGHLLLRLGAGAEDDVELNDAGRAVVALAKTIKPNQAFLAKTDGGIALAEIGLEGDLEACGQLDLHEIVPEIHDQALTVTGG
jgi:2-phosphosulfolactate phosphatase